MNNVQFLKMTALYVAACVCSLSVSADETDGVFAPIEPVYSGSTVGACDWGGNWFISVAGGANAFVGQPRGCGDLFDRIRPSVTGSVGKWFNSAWGIRAVYQGFEFKDCEFSIQNFHNIHADLMCNLTNGLGVDWSGMSRFDCIPYVGTGIILNGDGSRHPFALSYGVQARYHLTGRLHVLIEAGGSTTFSDFDGWGSADAMADNLISLSAGLSFTIGRTGWKRHVEAAPYISQNEKMRRYIEEQKDTIEKDRRTIVELRKILELEGLLSKYDGNLEMASSMQAALRNNYSGLNSLRRRMAERDSVSGEHMADIGTYQGSGVIQTSDGNGKYRAVSIPVFFFFKIGTHLLTDSSQLVNLDEIIRIANKYNLMVNVSGAADSATGTVEINNRLSAERTDYIISELLSRGISEDRIVRNVEGGIDRYESIEANRNSMVNLVSEIINM